MLCQIKKTNIKVVGTRMKHLIRVGGSRLTLGMIQDAAKYQETLSDILKDYHKGVVGC